MANVDFALSYVARGWRVMPIFNMEGGLCSCKNPRCSSPGKHPMINNWDVNASSDPSQIREWWAQRPDASIAIATGRLSGIWSLDVDGTNGLRTMHELSVSGRVVPLTFWFKTGGGGRQVFFAWPRDGKEVRNRVGVFNNVDIRGENGYIVAPPSNHSSGRQYMLMTPMNQPVVQAPDWLLETASARREVVLIPGNGGLSISNGGRNAELYAMGAKLKDTFPGIKPEVLLAFLDSVNKNHCEDPLQTSEIKSLVKNIWKYGPSSGG